MRRRDLAVEHMLQVERVHAVVPAPLRSIQAESSEPFVLPPRDAEAVLTGLRLAHRGADALTSHDLRYLSDFEWMVLGMRYGRGSIVPIEDVARRLGFAAAATLRAEEIALHKLGLAPPRSLPVALPPPPCPPLAPPAPPPPAPMPPAAAFPCGCSAAPRSCPGCSPGWRAAGARLCRCPSHPENAAKAARGTPTGTARPTRPDVSALRAAIAARFPNAHGLDGVNEPALALLPAYQREVLAVRFLHGLDIEMTALQIGTYAGAVERWQRMALNKLGVKALVLEEPRPRLDPVALAEPLQAHIGLPLAPPVLAARVAALTPREATVVRLVFLARATPAPARQVAIALGQPDAVVESALRRALNKLRGATSEG